MPEIKKKGILAVPGEYKFGDTTEVKTAEELKLAAQRQPILTLTLGHPAGSLPSESDYIGTVAQKWNEEKQRVEGDFWFYDEHIPPHIRERIVNDVPLKISAGYTVDRIEEGIQKGILYSHIAIIDGGDPKCPLDKCGVNVRMESNSNLRYEQEQEIDEPKEPEVTETVETVPTTVTFTEKQFEQLLEAIRPPVPAPPAEQKPEVEEKVIEEVTEEPAAPTPPEPRMEPEKVIPTGTSPSAEEFATNDDMVAKSIKILGDREKQ